MDWLLKRGQMLVARGMQSACIIQDLLGEGGQAEVYRARVGDQDYALKWYRPEYLHADRRLWERLKTAINTGTPTDRFLWPFDLVSLPHHHEYGGYLMPIRPPEFVSVVEITRGRVDTTFRSLMTLGYEMAHSFMKLHALGMCYRDINYGNFFFHPQTGEIRIADTDNVDVNMKPGGILGTPGPWAHAAQLHDGPLFDGRVALLSADDGSSAERQARTGAAVRGDRPRWNIAPLLHFAGVCL
jgi:DNA-binding helix-hairpin-helix protein with protein kinase domain